MRTVLTCLVIVCVALQAQAAGQKADVKNAKKAAVKPVPKQKTLAAKPAAVEVAKKTPKSAAAATAMKVTVVSVEGVAQKKCVSDPKAKWQAVKAGEILDELTLVRTGLGSKVVLRFADRGEVTVKNGTKIGIASFRKQGNLAKTRLGLKYGSIHANVDSSKSPNDFRVATPVATLSVRGSKSHISYGARGFGVSSTQSVWRVKTARGKMSVGKGESTNGGLTKARLLAGRARDTHMGDTGGGLTQQEIEALRLNGGGRGFFYLNGGFGFYGLFPIPRLPIQPPCPNGEGEGEITYP